jgi:hypothetical protein
MEPPDLIWVRGGPFFSIRAADVADVTLGPPLGEIGSV